MKAIYPGTFDPITNGHLDILTRAAGLFDEVILAIYANPQKTTFFSVEERVALAKESSAPLPQVQVVSFHDQLMIDYARSIQAHVIIRGLRAISDFENEFSYAQANRKLAPEFESIFLMTSLDYAFLSSTTVKEIARLHGNIDGMVPSPVAKALKNKFQPLPR
ncbi:pantetheine-phosphate adenylyltransferase [Candidatus Wirthbacteria bacterium CG2_30_54_11]|uniref:Phosphopantetheine adenylyltransferase n=1 Tax=Candidatus Wirthbacteria bacterium CG2_30_54_11 TaxID=1817892 RepID=A0A1J5J4V8_9BACT|nr:MAG: pantetheine-phosphate adenylyltransferase [Candidatus Wirthbacteria bacterium CG2_30_54_11]